MKRWQLWSSIVGGVLSVGSPATYFGWQQWANRGEASAQTVSDAPISDSTLKLPKPVPVSLGEDPPTPDNLPTSSFVKNVSAESPADGGSGESKTGAAQKSFGRDDRRPARSSFPVTDSQAGPPKPRSGGFTTDAPVFDGQDAADAVQAVVQDISQSTSGNGEVNETSDAAQSAGSGGSSGGTFGNNKLRQIPTDPLEDDAANRLPSAPEPREVANDGAPGAKRIQNGSFTNDRVPPRGNPDGASSPLGSTPSDSSSIGGAPIRPAPSVPVTGLGGNSGRAIRSPADSAIINESRDISSARDSLGAGPAPTRERPSLPAARSLPSAPAESHTSDAPGERRLEGSQIPTLSLEKNAPEEIQVGKPTKFSIKIRNTGNVAAHNVIVTDCVPSGTQFIGSTPETRPLADGTLVWELEALQSAEEATFTIDLMPQTEGEIGSVAQVTFSAQVAVRTLATRPLLTVEHSGPARVLIGDKAPFTITVSNPGSGVASGVVVEVDVPSQLAHEGGREIMSDRFDLRPNETRKLDLILTAAQAGIVESIVRAVGDAGLKSEHRTQLEIIAPQLQLGVNGPTRRYLDRQVTYQIAIANPGTAAANEIELVAYLPQGLKFVGTDRKGRYEQGKHAVYWSLEELPAGESGVVQLSAMPIDTGEQKLHIEGRAALDLSSNFDHTTLVEALTELVFTVADENDPIEVGADTSYEIRITNNGSKNATQVQLAALLPPELTPLKADGPTKVTVQGQQVVAEPLAQLAPGEEVVYRLSAKGKKAGDHLIRVQVVSDEFSTPVTKEESTKVYADE